MTNDVSARQIVARIILGILIFSGCFFGSAGTFNWPAAWAYLLLQFSFSSMLAAWLKKHNPALLKERLRFMKQSAKTWDKAILKIGTAIFIPYIIVPGLDAVRYEWSHVPKSIQYSAFAFIAVALAVIFLVMRENTYLSRFVEIQEGHKVITSGPYKYVRHPMYSAVIIYFFCFPLALGSLYGTIPAFLMVLLTIIRTILEDRMLHRDLTTYKEYAEKVRFKLIPGLW